jgi:DNA-binding IclR family transcriptional regulator
MCDMEQRAMSYHSQGLARALRLLREIGFSEEPLALAELAPRLGVPKSTLVRLLAVLEDERFVQRVGDPPAFQIGDSMLEIADQVLRRADAVDLASPYLRELADRTSLTANVGVLAGASVLHVCVQEPDRPLRFRSSNGSLDHTYCTGLGKVLLSALAPERITDHLPQEPFTGFTPQTITTVSGLHDELARIRARGYGVDLQERDPGVTCIAMLVPNAIGAVVAVSVSGPTGELDEARRDELLPMLRATTEGLAADARFLSSLRSVRGSFPGVVA